MRKLCSSASKVKLVVALSGQLGEGTFQHQIAAGCHRVIEVGRAFYVGRRHTSLLCRYLNTASKVAELFKTHC